MTSVSREVNVFGNHDNSQIQIGKVLDGIKRIIGISLHVTELDIDIELGFREASVAQLNLGGTVTLAFHALLCPVGFSVDFSGGCELGVLVDCEVDGGVVRRGKGDAVTLMKMQSE